MLSEEQARKIIDELYNSSEFAEFRRERIEFDQVVTQKWPANIPELYEDSGVTEYHSYEAQYAENIVLQEMHGAKPVYAIMSRALEAGRREGAQNFELFANRQWIVWNDSEEPPYDLVCGDQARRGIGVYKLDLASESVSETDGTKRWDIWPDRPSKDGQSTKDHAKEIEAYKLRVPTPFTLEAVDITCCAWQRDRRGVCNFVEKSKRSLSAVAEAYNLALDQNEMLRFLGPAQPWEYQSGTLTKTVEFMELCTRDWIYHFVQYVGRKTTSKPGSLFLGAWPNPFGAVRYVLAPGCIRVSAGDVGKRFRPLIEASIETAKEDTDFGTMRKYAAYQAGYPVMDLVTKDTGQTYFDPDTHQARIYIHPMKAVEYQLPAGTDLKPRGNAGIDLDKAMAWLYERTKRYGPQDVLAGGTAGEREAAWSLSIRGEKAQKGIEPGLDGQKRALKEIARLVAHCVKFWAKEPVYIWTVVHDEFGNRDRQQVKVTPDDIEEDFDIDVEMNYKSTAIRLANEENLRRANADGFVTRLRVQEEGLGVDDPIQEDALIALEKLDKATAAINLYDTIEGMLIKTHQDAGLPPPTAEKLAGIMAAVFGMKAPTEARRPATPVRATGSLEAPTTPTAQRVI